MSAIVRKARQLWADPVLRRWLARRMVGLEKSPPAFTAGAPPYLASCKGAAARCAQPQWNAPEVEFEFLSPSGELAIELPGETIEITENNPGELFERTYNDLETVLGAHRFAWVPLLGRRADPHWVAAIWDCWIEKYCDDQTGWPWHAYTAAERAINIIDFAHQFGLPGNRDRTVQSLADHADAIRKNLEYFGEHYTSNHLSNNGRGLLRIGVALDLEEYAEIGAKIMIAEAGRIFGRSGLLKEGSSHYHLLITRNYIDAWLAADSVQMEQATLLGDIAERAVAAISGLCLPGGMPLIGDISPDAPPDHFSILSGRQTLDTAWPSMLSDGLREAATSLIGRVSPISPDKLAEDGWHRFGAYEWHALAYVPPDGWPPMPGHGHQDLTGFELHDHNMPVIVDPGRGSYADPDFASACVHSGLTIDNHNPSPTNRPHYNETFRRRIVRHTPAFERTQTGHVLRSHGFARLSGVGVAEREWQFNGDALRIHDRIDGRGKRQITRRFVTAADVELGDDGVILSLGRRRWRISAETVPVVSPSTSWTAYGKGSPGQIISFSRTEKLPYQGTTVLERL